MCFWDEMALFNCDGTVERRKYFCDEVLQSGCVGAAEFCKEYETGVGCKHSETDRPVPHQAIYRHVCQEDAWRPPARSGIPWKFTPVLREPFSVFPTGRPREGAQLKDGLMFRWCDGSVCTVEDVFGRNAGRFNWRGVDLLLVDEEEVCRLLGKGKGIIEHWIRVWSGQAEADEGGKGSKGP